jgi:hypothetical protein
MRSISADMSSEALAAVNTGRMRRRRRGLSTSKRAAFRAFRARPASRAPFDAPSARAVIARDVRDARGGKDAVGDDDDARIVTRNVVSRWRNIFINIDVAPLNVASRGGRARHRARRRHRTRFGVYARRARRARERARVRGDG